MYNKKTARFYVCMLLPGFAFLIVFCFVPMGGVVIAFQDFIPALGVLHSDWAGLGNFIYLFQLPDIWQVLKNTVVISLLKIAAGLIVPIIVALLLNEVTKSWFKRTVQTIIYLPYFISWVLLAGVLSQILSVDGVVNSLLASFGLKDPIMFLGSNTWFRPVLIITNIWKEFGFGTIIYLAAITNISPSLYEAAAMDGAKRMQLVRYITIPGISATIVLLTVLSLQNVLNAGFDQVFNLYNALVYQTGDIIDTYVYRTAFFDAQFGLATAVGLLKSVVSFFLIVLSYKLAAKFANYRIF